MFFKVLHTFNELCLKFPKTYSQYYIQRHYLVLGTIFSGMEITFFNMSSFFSFLLSSLKQYQFKKQINRQSYNQGRNPSEN